MKTAYLIFLLSFASSCSINVYRPIKKNVVDLDKELNQFLEQYAAKDTLLTMRSEDCQPGSKDYLIIVYKNNGQTHSKAFCSWGNFPVEANLRDFNWDTIYNGHDDIRTEVAQPVVYARVIEGDTTWKLSDGLSGEVIWAFKLMCQKDTTEWWTSYSERSVNPSMTKTKVSDYIFSETYNKAHGFNPIYGEQQYKKAPLISRRK